MITKSDQRENNAVVESQHVARTASWCALCNAHVADTTCPKSVTYNLQKMSQSGLQT